MSAPPHSTNEIEQRGAELGQSGPRGRYRVSQRGSSIGLQAELLEAARGFSLRLGHARCVNALDLVSGLVRRRP